jgi:hypothetical protein
VFPVRYELSSCILKSISSSCRRETYKWFWKEYRFRHESRSGPKPKTTVLTRTSGNVPLRSVMLGLQRNNISLQLCAVLAQQVKGLGYKLGNQGTGFNFRQTSSGADPASYEMCTGSCFPSWKAVGALN